MNINKESLELVHVITPGDHFSPRTGSAIPTVVHGLSSALNKHGIKSSVIVDETTFTPRYESCDVLEVAYDLVPMRRISKVLDVISGALCNSRDHVSKRYEPVRTKLGSFQEAVVFYHNTLAPSAVHKSHYSRHLVYSWWHNDLTRTLTRRELCTYVKNIDGIICCSHYLRGRITRHLPDSLSRKVHVVQNGVALPSVSSRSRSLSGRPTIGFVGRVTPEKGVHLLLDAVAANSTLKDSCDVVIVGNHGFSASDPLTQYEQNLRNKATKTGVSVTFLPFQNRTQLPDLFQKIDILVVPSVFPEPFGLVVLEANSYGIPVIHSNAGGLLEAGGGQSLVFDVGDHHHLARKLNELVCDAEVYTENSLRAIAWASLSVWDARSMTLLSLLKNQ